MSVSGRGVGERDPHGERGETLVEVLVAVSILGLAALAVLSGLMLAIKVSDIHRKTTDSSAEARNYVEAIENYVSQGKYVACASTTSYAPATVNYTPPPGWTASYLKPLAVSATGVASTCTTDTGVQKTTVTLTSPDGRGAERVTLVLRRDCSSRTVLCP